MKKKLTFLICWYQNDWGLYGRRNELITRELAKRPEVSGVLHLEPPLSEEWLSKKGKKPGWDDNLSVNKKRFAGFKNENGVYLYTPLVPKGLLPGERRELLSSEIKKHLKKLGPVSNLVLLLYPPNEFSLLLLDELKDKTSLIVSDIVDDARVYYRPGSSSYRKVDERYARIISSSDIVFAVSETLVSRFSYLNDNIYYLPNAFEAALFSGEKPPEAKDIASIPHPRILYTGNLLRRLDFPLIRELARSLPEMNFVFIGLPYPRTKRELAGVKNIHLLGPRPYQEIPHYLEASDLLIMPHEISEETASMNPIKLYLYLASGKPVVTTGVAGSETFEKVISITKGVKGFARAIERELADETEEKKMMRKGVVKKENWERRVDELLGRITPLIEEKKEERDIFYFEYERTEVEELVPKTALRILDIGCAYGKLGERLKKNGALEVVGIELDQTAGEKAKTVIDRVIIGDAEEEIANLKNRYFDAIILSDSLEHMRRPEKILAEAAKKIKRSGKLILSVPNVRHWSVVKRLLEGTWDYEESGILDRDHLHFFTRKSITSLLSKTGFNIDNIKNVYHQKIPEGVVTKLKEAGLAVDDLKEEGRVYQYLITASLNPPPLASSIIPVFNQLPYTKECLDSIRKNTGAPCEIIVIDNGSTDGSYEYLKSLYYVRLIRNEENRGFAAACNQGIKVARGEYIALLNNDVIVTPHWLMKLINCAESGDEVGLVGPVSNYVSGPQQVRVASPDAPPRMIIDKALANIWQEDRSYIPVDRLVGFALLIKRKVIEEIGLLDESYQHGGYEDDDYSLRAIKAGFKLLIARDVFIYHYGSRSFAPNRIDIFAQAAKNKKIFLDKWKKEPSPGIVLPEGGQRLLKAKSKTLSGKIEIRKPSKSSLLLLAHEFPPDDPLGGVGRYTYLLARELIKEGHMVTVLSPLPPGRGDAGDLAEYRLSGIKVVRIGAVRSPSHWLRNERIENWFADFIRKSRFPLIHFQHLQRLPLSLPLLAMKEGTPYIMTLHDFFLLCHHSHLLRFGRNHICPDVSNLTDCAFCLRDEYFPHRRDIDLSSFTEERRKFALEILKSAERTFAPSIFIKEMFEKAGVGRKIELRPLGIKPPTEAFERKKGGIPTLGFIGNISPIKGVSTLLSAIERLQGKVCLIILGDIYGEKSFKKEMSSFISRLSPSVLLPGKEDSLDSFFTRIDALVIPSLLETYSFTAREALARGIPVIAARAGALPELIKEGENGFLFTPEDEEELTLVIKRFSDLLRKRAAPDFSFSPPLISSDASLISEIAAGRRAMKTVRDNPPLLKTSAGSPSSSFSLEKLSHREEEVADFGKRRESVSASLGLSGHYSGLLPLHLRDGISEPVEIKGRSGRRLIPDNRKTPPFLYFAIDPTFSRRGKPFVIEVTYYDGGKTGFLIEYDSADQEVRKVAEKPGAFKETKKVLREGTGNWRRALFLIPDALFAGRVNTADFRIRGDVPGDDSIIIGEVKVSSLKLHLLGKLLGQRLSSFLLRRRKSQPAEIILGEDNISQGLILTEVEDGKTKPVNLSGTAARESVPSPGSPPMVYFSLSPGARNEGRMAVITVCYLDIGDEFFLLQYDSRDKGMKKVANAPGAFKDTRRVRKKGSESFREVKFYLPDALFSGRINGADFRLVGELSPGNRLVIRRVGLEYSTLKVISHLLVSPKDFLLFGLGISRRMVAKVRPLLGGGFKKRISALLDGKEIAVVFGAENTSKGLLQVDVPPHPTRFDVIKGKSSCILLRKEGDDRELMLFIVDPKFIKRDKTPYLTVEYLDTGYTSFHIEYDSSDRSMEKPSSPKEAFKQSLPIPRYNSGQWKKKVVVLPDARFSRRCDGFDFIITAEPNDPYFNCFHQVRLSYNPPSLLRRLFKRIVLPKKVKKEQVEAKPLSFPHFEQPTASIIIVSYNNLSYTLECLRAVRDNTKIPYEVIIIDNASSSEVKRLLNSVSGITLIENEENRGFAPACNQGADRAKGKFLCFLNNDTIPTQSWLRSMIEVARKDPEVGIVGSKLIYPQSNLTQHAGVGLTPELIPYHINAYLPADHPAVNRQQEVFAVTGACLLIRRDLFFELDRFDEGFINGLEDIDLSLKVRAKGMRVIYTPKSVVYHYEGLSPGRRKNEEANLARLFAKWQEELKLYCNQFPASSTHS